MILDNIKYAHTAYNRSVTVRRLSAARLRKTTVGLRPLCCFAPPHFFAPEKTLRVFPYRAQKNVSYRQNVKCKFFKMGWSKKRYKNDLTTIK